MKAGVSKTHGRDRSGRKGTPSLRNRIRDLERFLAHTSSSLPEKDLSRKRKELASLKALRGEHARRERERQISERYRMVRFFERRKIERKLKQAIRDGHEEKVEELKKDLRYVKLFPKNRKYVALFPKEGHTEVSRKMVEEMRRVIDELAGVSAVNENTAGGEDKPQANTMNKQENGVEDDFLVVESE